MADKGYNSGKDNLLPNTSAHDALIRQRIQTVNSQRDSMGCQRLPAPTNEGVLITVHAS